MLFLIIHLTCFVEDEDEAVAKTQAARSVLAVYPFFKVSAEVRADLVLDEQGGDPS